MKAKAIRTKAKVHVRAIARLSVYLLTFAFFLPAGCGRPKVSKPTPGWYGPTQSISEVVTRLNANNERLRTLYLRHEFGAELVEEPGRKPTKISGVGVIMYRAPDELIMTGSEVGIGKIFEIGCNPTDYWLAVPQSRVDTVWYGQMRHLGKPCVKEIPIRPDLLMEVLGVFEIDPNLARFPAPVMRFNSEQDAYVFTWVMPQVDRFIAVKEVWYDRQTMRPRRVVLFGAEGRVLLSAELSEHRPVEVPGAPPGQRPTVPGKYDLFFPDTQSRMAIRIEDAYLQRDDRPGTIPFRRPNPDNFAKAFQLDEACDD